MRFLRWSIGAAAAVFFLLACASFFGANSAYDQSSKWFARATYNAHCAEAAEAAGCVELSAQQPNWPFGVEVTNMDVLLTQASAMHNTGSGILALGGLLMATSGVLVASIVYTQRTNQPA